MKKDIRYIIKRIIIGVALFLIFGFFKSCEVHAATYNMPYQDIKIDNDSWFSNYGYYGTTITTSGTSINFDIYMNESSYPFGADQATAIIADVCVSASLQEVTRSYGYGSSCPNSCFTQNPYFVDLHATCKYNNNNSGYMWRIYMPVLKWNYGAGCGQTGCHPTLNDSITFKSKNYNGSIMFQNIYITDEVIGTDYNSSLDNINSQIIAAHNQAHTDSQNTQNAINDAKNQAHQDAQQAHQDSQNTQSAINGVNDSLNDDSVGSADSKASEWASKSLSDNAVANMVTMPITLLHAYLNGLNGSCSSFSLGTLYEHELTLPCINLSSYFGSTLWGVIDILFSGFMIYALGKKFVKIFNDFTNLKDNQVDELYGGGN